MERNSEQRECRAVEHRTSLSAKKIASIRYMVNIGSNAPPPFSTHKHKNWNHKKPTRLQRMCRHVEGEQVAGGLRRTQHVLAGCDELDRRVLDLRTTLRVAVGLRCRVEVELVGHLNNSILRIKGKTA